MQISTHFTLEEAVFSDTAIRLGIDNTPSEIIVEHMRFAARGLEALRDYINEPIIVNSWYRSIDLNKAIPGSSPTSAHTSGYAIDCKTNKMSILALCKNAANLFVSYDQIIYEYGGWMHISFDPKNRKQLLTIFKGGKYKAGLLTKQEYLNP